MSYNRDNYSRVMREFSEKRLNAEKAADSRRKELSAKLPEYARVDSALAELGFRIYQETVKGGPDLDERISKIKSQGEELRRQRDKIAEQNGYPKDYTKVRFECEKCGDTGFVGREKCECLKRALSEAGYISSGLGKLLTHQNFSSFSLELYPTDKLPGKDYSARDVMKIVFDKCKDYADSFTTDSGSLLFVGGTGLGKTHLSSAIAKTVIDRGFDVVYDSAPNIINLLGREQYYSTSPETAEKYFGCDLLIVDDLGTEYPSKAAQSAVYNLINSRLVSGKPMIVSTNLTAQSLEKQYDGRIISRLFGEFCVLLFEGRDIRMKKI